MHKTVSRSKESGTGAAEWRSSAQFSSPRLSKLLEDDREREKGFEVGETEAQAVASVALSFSNSGKYQAI